MTDEILTEAGEEILTEEGDEILLESGEVPAAPVPGVERGHRKLKRGRSYRPTFRDKLLHYPFRPHKG